MQSNGLVTLQSSVGILFFSADSHSVMNVVVEVLSVPMWLLWVLFRSCRPALRPNVSHLGCWTFRYVGNVMLLAIHVRVGRPVNGQQMVGGFPGLCSVFPHHIFIIYSTGVYAVLGKNFTYPTAANTAVEGNRTVPRGNRRRSTGCCRPSHILPERNPAWVDELITGLSSLDHTRY